jgi:pimeloyl-ACP methyl ester carboxylesterase
MLGFKKIIVNEEAEWLVFLHGLGGNSTLFYKQTEYLSKYYNLLLIDLPGHGVSKGLDLRRYSANQVAEKIVELLNTLAISKAHIIAFSLGTIIANALMNIAPDKIKTLTLSGPVLRWSWWSNILVKGAYRFRHFASYMTFYKIFAYLMMPKKNHTKSRYFFVREASKLGRKEYMKWAYMVTIPEKIYTKTLELKNSIPKLYIVGGEDHMFVKEAIKAANQDDGITLKIIKESGHVCILEKGTETNKAILEFIGMHGDEKNNSYLSRLG